MGKSLSILSLVAKTSDLADEWLHGNQEGSKDVLRSWKTRSKATLIIVPSAGKIGLVIAAEGCSDANSISVNQRMDT
jgi:hypothetical protein